MINNDIGFFLLENSEPKFDYISNVMSIVNNKESHARFQPLFKDHLNLEMGPDPTQPELTFDPQ